MAKLHAMQRLWIANSCFSTRFLSYENLAYGIFAEHNALHWLRNGKNLGCIDFVEGATSPAFRRLRILASPVPTAIVINNLRSKKGYVDF